MHNCTLVSEIKEEYVDKDLECKIEYLQDDQEIFEDTLVEVPSINYKKSSVIPENKAKIHTKTLFTEITIGNETIYKCTICVKTTIKPEMLLDHLKFHLNEYVLSSDNYYACPINTGKLKFTNFSDLEKHLSEDFSTPHLCKEIFKCNSCSCEFSSKNLLKRHNTECLHTSYKCKICEEIFSDVYFFKMHKCLHKSTEKGYVKLDCCKVTVDCDSEKIKSIVDSGSSHLKHELSLNDFVATKIS